MKTVTLDVRPPAESITALLQAGMLGLGEGGGIGFPYEAVKVEFLLQAA